MKEIFDRRQIGARTEAELKRMHLTKMDNMRKWQQKLDES